MQVLLKRDFITAEDRFRASANPVEIPDGMVLPRDAEVIDDKAKPARKGRPRKIIIDE